MTVLNEQRDLLSSLARLTTQQVDRKEENRRRFPTAAAFKDRMEQVFGTTKMIFAEECNDRVGREETGWVDMGLIVEIHEQEISRDKKAPRR